jgi:hypothetical protein
MVWIREFDELPWEVRQSTATTLRYWPKVDGANCIASAVAGEVTFQVMDSSGTEVQAATNATPIKATGPLAGRTASNSHTYIPIAIPSIATLGEHLTVRILWQQSGQSVVYRDIRQFDVVMNPFGQPQASLSDLIAVRNGIAAVLDRMGQTLGYASGTEAQEGAAAMCTYHGRLAVSNRIRAQVVTDRSTAVSENRAPVLGYETVYARPALTVDRNQLLMVERYEALAHLYRAIAPAPDDGEDPGSGLYRHFRDAASSAWLQMPPITYDGAEDLVPDSSLANMGRVTRMRRVQG